METCHVLKNKDSRNSPKKVSTFPNAIEIRLGRVVTASFAAVICLTFHCKHGYTCKSAEIDAAPVQSLHEVAFTAILQVRLMAGSCKRRTRAWNMSPLVLNFPIYAPPP